MMLLLVLTRCECHALSHPADSSASTAMMLPCKAKLQAASCFSDCCTPEDQRLHCACTHYAIICQVCVGRCGVGWKGGSPVSLSRAQTASFQWCPCSSSPWHLQIACHHPGCCCPPSPQSLEWPSQAGAASLGRLQLLQPLLSAHLHPPADHSARLC